MSTPRRARRPFSLHLSRVVLTEVVVDETELNLLVVLGNDNVAGIAPLPIDLLEAPDLGGRPAVVDVFDMAVDVALALGAGALGVALEPALLQELVLNLGRGPPVALAAAAAKEPVRMLAELEVEAAVLRGALDAARGGLVNVDVGDRVRGGGRGLGCSLVLLDVEGESRQANGLADHPADTL
ncbi:hypothetical protein VDGD_20853 [Verticillium dahliae]|nr:hypothetical protein VDGD_20853 [Verticillium dahliae]